MNDVIPEMSGDKEIKLNDPVLDVVPDQKAGLEIGVIDDKIGYRIIGPSGEPVILLFTVEEMYSIMSAQEQAIAHIRSQRV